jgi:hypothetical protein
LSYTSKIPAIGLDLASGAVNRHAKEFKNSGIICKPTWVSDRLKWECSTGNSYRRASEDFLAASIKKDRDKLIRVLLLLKILKSPRAKAFFTYLTSTST